MHSLSRAAIANYSLYMFGGLRQEHATLNSTVFLRALIVHTGHHSYSRWALSYRQHYTSTVQSREFDLIYDIVIVEIWHVDRHGEICKCFSHWGTSDIGSFQSPLEHNSYWFSVRSIVNEQGCRAFVNASTCFIIKRCSEWNILPLMYDDDLWTRKKRLANHRFKIIMPSVYQRHE